MKVGTPSKKLNSLDIDKLRTKVVKSEIMPRKIQIAKLMQELGAEDKGPRETYNKKRIMREVSKIEKQLSKIEKALSKKIERATAKGV